MNPVRDLQGFAVLGGGYYRTSRTQRLLSQRHKTSRASGLRLC